MSRTQTPVDERDLRGFLATLWAPGEVREVRIPKHNRYAHTASGYFDTQEALVNAVLPWDGRANIYVTLNPINAALLARASNRIVERAEATTSDIDIVRRSWLFVDVDPVRPAGISASDEELEAARSRGKEVAHFLTRLGWPDPVRILSGNGVNLLYRIDLPNEAASLELVKGALEALAARFNDDKVKIDTSVSNAGRIIGLAGTMKVKGDSTADRPHRRSHLERVPDAVEPVPEPLLHDLAAMAPRHTRGTVSGTNSYGRLAEMLKGAETEYDEQAPDAAGILWYHVRECPFHGNEGRSFECGVGEAPDGRFAGKCFHERGKDKGWREWKVALGLRGSRNGHAPLETASGDQHRPVIIVTGRHLREIAEDAWSALDTANVPPTLFLHGGSIARIDATGASGPRILSLSDAWLRGHMDRIADWVSVTSRDDVAVQTPARPPKDVINDMMALNKGRLPDLRGITATPTLASDGRLETTPGYQAVSALYYVPVGTLVPHVPEIPSEGDVELARALLLDDWLIDFPFADPSSRAHAVAIALTVIARELIDGPTPLFAVDAPAPGSGKGLLVQTSGAIAMGTDPPVTTESRDEDEFRKRVTALLREGHPMIVIDNVKRPVNSAVLAAALTATVWQDRLLGSSETLVLPNRAAWIATGNNLQLDGDIARRTVWVRLDPKVDRPWERSGFTHDPLLKWVRQHRHELVWALLVLARRWIALGSPPWRGRPMGSFEAWCDVVGGILQCAGIEGFLGNRDELYRQVDTETDEWRAFVEAWWEAHGSRPVKAGELTPLIVEGELLPSVVASIRGEASDRQVATRLGRALKQRRDRVIGAYVLRYMGADSHQKGGLYRLECAELLAQAGPCSADVPPDKPSSMDSAAERAERAELDPRPSRERGTTLDGGVQERGAEHVPQVPQHPQGDSKWGVLAAEHPRLTHGVVPQVPQAGGADGAPSIRPCYVCGTEVDDADLCEACETEVA